MTRALADAIARVAEAKRQRDNARTHFLSRCQDGTLHQFDTDAWQRAERVLNDTITGLIVTSSVEPIEEEKTHAD